MTCCGKQDDLKILSHAVDLKRKSDGVSLDCLEFTQNILCSRCDGMKGVGVTQGLCLY